MATIYSIHLNDLETILMYATRMPLMDISIWKDQLPLLGVCRLWTKILLPVIYGTAFLQFGRRVNDNQPCKWESNIDRIGVHGYYRLVKSLYINVKDNANSAVSVSRLAKLLRFNEMDWSSIQKLTIGTSSRYTQSPYKAIFKVQSIKLNTLAHQFLRYMPNVKSLSFCDFSFPSILDEVFKIIAPVYTPQLQNLNLDSQVSMSQLYFTAQLTCLNISYWPSHTGSITFPSVYARALQNLKLLNLPTDYCWNLFFDFATPGHIYFDSLRQLEISYDLHEQNNDKKPFHDNSALYPIVLHFPKLQFLRLRRCHPDCKLLSAVFPTYYLTHVFIDDCSLEVMHKKLFTIKAQKLNVEILSSPYYSAAYYLEMNSVFSKNVQFTYRKLAAFYYSAVIDYERLQLDYLYEMYFHVATPFQILTVLFHSPRLFRLSVSQIKFGNDCSLSAIELATNEGINQGHLELKTLHIKQIEGNSPRSAALAFIQHLITRATKLWELVVPSDYKHDVMFIINRIKQRMPHLDNVGVYSQNN